ncbi:MAG: RnfH family protein [Legionellaceae bacterium]|mgnify:CR=1 FL=1|nr:RnfH family protein [Legionellaceae bacterium]|tara:strand:+ start:871 stop:1146 length:276 start_codon:yes stop_codon:yes gene_type:complete
MIRIEVVYASPEKQSMLSVNVLPNSTVEDAIIASNIINIFPEIDLQTNAVGIFGKRAALTTRLKDKDRVEIYRPLLIDPMEARRLRAKKNK